MANTLNVFVEFCSEGVQKEVCRLGSLHSVGHSSTYDEHKTCFQERYKPLLKIKEHVVVVAQGERIACATVSNYPAM